MIVSDKPIFDSIIIVTDRVVLDSQLQDTINGFEHKKVNLVEAIDDKKRSRGLTEAINDASACCERTTYI